MVNFMVIPNSDHNEDCMSNDGEDSIFVEGSIAYVYMQIKRKSPVFV